MNMNKMEHADAMYFLTKVTTMIEKALQRITETS